MLGPRQDAQAALFCEFSLDDQVPQDHLLRSIDRFVDLSSIRAHLADFYSHTGRPSVDPELLIRMLLVGYCFSIRSERRLCEEVHLNLAYRWFCRLDLNDRIPDHSTFSKNRHGRFSESELLRHLFETAVARCITEGLVRGQRMAVNASLIEADANKHFSASKEEWDASRIDVDAAPRAVREYPDTLDEAAFGAASEVQPKFTSFSDPASQWTVARKGPSFFAYSDNYLIDTDHGVIVDVEATRSVRQAEVRSTKTMLNRVKQKFDLHPERLIADTAYGSGPMLDWLVKPRSRPTSPSSTKRDGQTAHSPVPILNGKPRKTNTFVPKAKRSSSSAETTQIPIAAPLAKAWPSIRPSNTHVRHALQSRSAAQWPMPEKSPVKNMKTLAMSPVPSGKRASTKSHPSSARRSRCSSHTSNASWAWGGSDYAAHAVQMTNSSSLPPPKNLRKLAKIFPAPQQTCKA